MAVESYLPNFSHAAQCYSQPRKAIIQMTHSLLQGQRH